VDGWFSHLRRDGRVARGSTVVSVDGGVLTAGSVPQWLFDTGDVLIFKGPGDALYRVFLDGRTEPLNTPPVAQFSAGGGIVQWTAADVIWTATGRDGSVAQVIEEGGDNRRHSIRVNGRTVVHERPVHWVKVESGFAVWSSFEPREVWGCRPDEAPEKLLDGLFGLPVITPSGPWVVVQTNTDLRVFPWGSTEGYIIPTGEDQNFFPDALWVNGQIAVTWNTGTGAPGSTFIDITAPRQSLTAAPTPTPEPPAPSPMTPDHSAIVAALHREHPALLTENSVESAARFTRLAALRLNAHDPEWGLLTKTPGEKNVDGFAIDAVIYRKTQQVVDIIGSAGDGPGTGYLTWGFQPKRDFNHWAQPTPVEDTPTPTPTPTPVPECKCDALQAQLDAQAFKIAAQDAEIAALKNRITAITERPAPEFELVSDKDGVEFTTGRSFAHSHSIRLRLVRK
jgi:hypothetical protein